MFVKKIMFILWIYSSKVIGSPARCTYEVNKREESAHNRDCVQNITCVQYNDRFEIMWTIGQYETPVDYIAEVKLNGRLEEQMVVRSSEHFTTIRSQLPLDNLYEAAVRRRVTLTQHYIAVAECTRYSSPATDPTSTSINASLSCNQNGTPGTWDLMTNIIIGLGISVLLVICLINFIPVRLNRKNKQKSQLYASPNTKDRTIGEQPSTTSENNQGNGNSSQNYVNVENETYNHLSHGNTHTKISSDYPTYSHLSTTETMNTVEEPEGLSSETGGLYGNIPHEEQSTSPDHDTTARNNSYPKVLKSTNPGIYSNSPLQSACLLGDLYASVDSKQIPEKIMEDDDIVRKSGPQVDLYTEVAIKQM